MVVGGVVVVVLLAPLLQPLRPRPESAITARSPRARLARASLLRERREKSARQSMPATAAERGAGLCRAGVGVDGCADATADHRSP